MSEQISMSAEYDTYKDNPFVFDQDQQEIQCSDQFTDHKIQAKVNESEGISEENQADNQTNENQNVFLFNEDQCQSQDHPYNQKNEYTIAEPQLNKSNINQNILRSKGQNEISGFQKLRNAILFKQQKSDRLLSNSDFESFFIKPQQIKKYPNPKPNIVTQSFEQKVKKIRESARESFIQRQKKKTLTKNAILSSRRLMNLSEKQYPCFKKNSFILPKGQFNEELQDNNFFALKQSKQAEPNSIADSKFNIKIQGAKIMKKTQCSAVQFEYLQQHRAIKVKNIKQFLFIQLSEQYKVNAIIKRVEGGFLSNLTNKTKYNVQIESNSKFLFSVVKQNKNKFVFSLNKQKCSQNNKNYLGQMISKDFSNTEFILYDSGFDPKQTKCIEFCYKQLASIKYEQSNGPRKFSVILSTNPKDFHLIQSKFNLLAKKWNDKKERKRMCKLYSKEPEFDQTDGNPKLDFKGVLGRASAKNFILQSDVYEDCLIFVRRTDDAYALEVKRPFSLIQAVAVCLSSIHYKTVF